MGRLAQGPDEPVVPDAGQMMLGGPHSPWRREDRRKLGGEHLEEALRLRDVLQLVTAEIADREPRRQVAADPGLDGSGHDRLAAVGGGTHACSAMHVEPHETVLVTHGRTRVDAHPDPDGLTRWPLVGGNGLLGFDGGADGIGRLSEHDEEAVALGAHLRAVPGGPG